MISRTTRFALLLVLLLSLPTARAAEPDYQGPDAGVLIYSASSITIPLNFTFHYKRLRLPSGGRFTRFDLERAPSLQTPMEPVVGAHGYFVIADQSERDLAIAKARHPDLPPVTNSVFDVSKLEHPAILSKAPEWVNVHPLRPWPERKHRAR